MQIRLFKKFDRTAWDEYAIAHPKGTFFHLCGWKEVVEKSFGHKSHYLLAVDSDLPNPKITGIFPLFSVKSLLFGRSMVSVPFASYGGILADNEKVRQALYNRAVVLTKEMSLDYLEIRNETDPLEGLPTKSLYFVFKKEISSDNDENLNAIPRKARRMVRTGIKNNLEARFGGLDLLDQFYALFSFNYRRLGTPVFAKSYLKNILVEFKDKCSVLIIFKDGKPLSCVQSFYFKDQVIPYYSGAFPDSNKHAANDFLYWALMCDAAEKGYKIFDFGRSKEDTGPYHFKRHWGFEPRPLPYQYFFNKIDEMPNLSPTNPKYQKKIELWKKMPLWATNLIGPRIVKYIP